VLLVDLLSIVPYHLQPPESDQFQRRLSWEIVHRVYSKAISYLSICDQSGGKSAHQRGTRVVMNVSVRDILLLTTKFCDVAKFNILTLLSLLSWCRLSFLIVGLKIFSLPLLHYNALKELAYGTSENGRKRALIYYNSCLLNHHFSAHMMHVNSNNDITKEIYMTSYH